MVHLSRVAVLSIAVVLTLQPAAALICETNCLTPPTAATTSATCHQEAHSETATLNTDASGGLIRRAPSHPCGHGVLVKPARCFIHVPAASPPVSLRETPETITQSLNVPPLLRSSHAPPGTRHTVLRV